MRIRSAEAHGAFEGWKNSGRQWIRKAGGFLIGFTAGSFGQAEKFFF
jgi:hypothetical protein